MNHKFFALLFWLLASLVLFPPNSQAAFDRADSLLNVLKSQPEDTHKVLTLNELFKATLNSEPLRALAYGQEALALAKRLDYKRGIARLGNNLGVLYSKRGDYQQSLVYFAQSQAMQVALNDTDGIANCEINTGNVRYKMGDYPRALLHYGKALEYYHLLSDTVRVLDAVNNIGSVYMEQGKYPDALQAFMAAMRLREQIGSPAEIATSCMNVGSIYQLQGMRAAAIEYFQRSLDLSTQAQDKFGRVAAMTSIAEIYMEMKHPDLAKPLLQEARREALEIDDRFGLASAMLGIANLNEMEGNLETAASDYRQALDICRDIGRTQGIAVALNHIGNLELGRKNLDAAQTALLESLQLSDSLAAQDLSSDNHFRLSQLHARKGNFAAAYDHHLQYTVLHDSLYSNVKTKQIAEMQAQYNAKSKQDEINRLHLQAIQDQLRIANAHRSSLILLAILLPIALLAVVFIMRSVQKQRHNRRIEEKNLEIESQRDITRAQNKQILEINATLEKIVEARTQAMRNANKELDTFLYQAAHALRRPLVRVEGLMQIIADEANAQVRQDLEEKLRKTLREMDTLLHQLIYASEGGQRDPKLEAIELAALVLESAPISRNDTVLRQDIPSGFILASDRYLLTGLLTAVLDNAFRFQDPAKAAHWVRVNASTDDAFATLCIEDNGVGIAADHLPHICEMFYKGSQQQGGNGLGLYLAQKIAQRLHGSLSVESTLGQGTTVTILLPFHTL